MKYNRNVYQALTMIMQFGINMLVPIFLCSFAGMYFDRKFNTSFWMILLFFVGTLAGFTNVFRFARKIYETPAVTRRRSTMTADKDGRERIKAGQIQDDWEKTRAGQIQDGREQVRDGQRQASDERDVQKRGGI